jgi:hypothetical protein
VFLGPVLGALDLASAALVVYGAGLCDSLGNDGTAGADQDGDGVGDLWLGAHQADRTAEVLDAGAVFLVPGATRGVMDAADAAAVLVGGNAGDHFGAALCDAGDLTGDGHSDLAVSAIGADHGADDGGAVYLFAGPFDGAGDAADALARWDGEAAGLGLGARVRAVGDLDGDGALDLGATGTGTMDDDPVAGLLLVLYGPFTDGQASARLTLHAEQAGDMLGFDLAGGADVDADGRDDLAVGAHFGDYAGADSGCAYLLLGRGI